VLSSRSKQITRRRTLDPEWLTFGRRMDSAWPDQSIPVGSDLPEREVQILDSWLKAIDKLAPATLSAPRVPPLRGQAGQPAPAPRKRK
jgi:hypothetical protein